MRLPTAAINKTRIAFPRWLLMLPVLLLASLLAAQGLNADVIWYDELTSIGHAGGLTGPFSAVDVLDSISEHSPKHGPLFFELLASWAWLVDWHHATLRSLTLFFGLLALAWVYRIGRDFVNWRVGLWASAFLALNVFWLEYSHEIRMYSLQLMLIMALIWHYLHIAKRPIRTRWHHWLGLTAAATLALYTQPISIFAHLAIGIYHLLFVPKTRTWLLLTLAFLVAGLLYLPWLPVTLHGINAKFDTGGDQAMTLGLAIDTCISLLGNGSWIMAALPLLSAARRLRDKSTRRRLAPIWILAALILVFLLGVNETIGLIPLRRARYFLMAWGLLAILIGCGLASWKRWWMGALYLLLFLGFGFQLRGEDKYLDYQGTIHAVRAYPPMHEYVAALQDLIGEQDYVLGFTNANFVNRRGKHGKSTADYYMEALLGNDGAFVPTHFNAEQLAIDIPEKLDDNPFLLFTFDPQNKPEIFELTKSIIESDYQRCAVILDTPQLFAQRYVYHTLDCEREYRPIDYANGIRIVDRFADFLPERDTLRVVTGWEVDEDDLLQEYNVSIQIHDADGEKAAQLDRHLYDDILKWHVAEFSTASLGPGDYRAVVMVYDRYPPHAKLTGADINSGEVATILPIAEFSIAG